MLNISEMIEKWGGTTKDCQEFEDIMNCLEIMIEQFEPVGV